MFDITDITDIFLSPALQQKLLFVKIIFITLSLFLIGFIVYLLKKTIWLKLYLGFDLMEFLSYKPYEKIGLIKKWERIKKRLEKGWEAEAKLAIIEADGFLNNALGMMGYGGESLGERLEQLNTDVLPSLDKVWEVHKIRNNIVHDPDYKFSVEKAREAIGVYEEALKGLEIF